MRHRRARLLQLAAAIFALASVLAAPPQAAAQATAWSFRVIADPAVVRARPDSSAPPIDAFAKGLEVKSYAAEGAWIRFLVTKPDGAVYVGYVAASDLELLDTKEEAAADFWTAPAAAFRGKGVTFRFSGGLGTLGGGDLLTGIQDRFASQGEMLAALGYAFVRADPFSFKTRQAFSGEILYHLTPRFGLGLGAAVAYAHTFGESVYAKYFPVENKAVAEPNIRTMAYFATASWLLPLSELLSVRLSGGPMWVQARFTYHGISPSYENHWDLIQRTDGSGLGVHASAALEINLNENAAIYVELAGRAGTVRAFSGSQVTTQTLANGMAYEDELSGTLYAVETEGKTLLMVLPDPSQAPGPYREAGYSLLGADARFGFRIRF